MNASVKPIFIFSLPRAGSTLMQRILGADPQIATATEPWILLPYLYTLKREGVGAEYSHWRLHQAVADFYGEFPRGKTDYLAEIRKLVLNLYTKLCQDNEQYFLDKTPRYHLIVKEVIQLFPDGKFIFLWRNPLSVAASIIQTFGLGYWNLRDYRIDLFDGLNNLIEASKMYDDRVLFVRYEDIIENPRRELSQVFAYLDLPFNPQIVSQFVRVDLKGNFGDPTGVKQYQSISKEPTEKWKQILNNPIRKGWSRRYLNWLGEERLSVMGYNLAQLMAELEESSGSMDKMPSDLKKIVLDSLDAWLDSNRDNPKNGAANSENYQGWWMLKVPYS
ncbi:sulfotransferase family protein [Limnospira platensis CENA597]|uniref:sulfotransferase family protein n=1 Tax=Limnospira platensis TaxID=118562 RepID=UPI003D6EF8AE